MDKLFEAVAARGHVCVGLDTAAEYIPEKERQRAKSPAEAVFAYNKALIDATSGIAACYKVQIAYYEEMGLAGLEAYARTLGYLRKRGALVIADIKRGDIADTASRYARAHFSGDFEADFVTLSPYLGMDSIDPWLEWAGKQGKGAFVLMRTSNKGRIDFEELKIEGGSPPLTPASVPESSVTPSPGAPAPNPAPRKVYDAVGDKLQALAAARPGKYGYGVFGAVFGADPKTEKEREDAARVRAERSNLFFLIPGYGAQGGAARDAALLFKDGNGGVVNASRSILKAWQTAAERSGLNPAEADNSFAGEAAREAVIEMRDALRKAAAEN